MNQLRLTPRQRKVLIRVAVETSWGRWYRAADHGERVTLASLHTHQILTRRARRGVEGEANTAYEYQTTQTWTEAIVKLIRKHQAKGEGT